uniref:hypothetical protein n=1 Tax=Streptomyces sp. WAC05458 TaxID=2487412 RepID=UPI001C8E5BA9
WKASRPGGAQAPGREVVHSIAGTPAGTQRDHEVTEQIRSMDPAMNTKASAPALTQPDSKQTVHF